MITTNKINVILSKGKLKSRQVTTKDLNPGIRVEPPKEPIKTRGVSTTTLPDVGDIIEKKRRDGIMAKLEKAKKAAKKEKPLKLEKPIEVKKPWNKMNAKERKEYQEAKKVKK